MPGTPDSPNLVVNSRLQIPRSELEFTYSKSSGPGGQNVNKVNSKALLRWGVLKSPSLSDDLRQRLVSRYAHRITTSGDLLISSQKSRDAGLNTLDCLEKLRALLVSVATPPVRRRPTRPSYGSRLNRLQNKRRQGEKSAGGGPATTASNAPRKGDAALFGAAGGLVRR